MNRKSKCATIGFFAVCFNSIGNNLIIYRCSELFDHKLKCFFCRISFAGLFHNKFVWKFHMDLFYLFFHYPSTYLTGNCIIFRSVSFMIRNMYSKIQFFFAVLTFMPVSGIITFPDIGRIMLFRIFFSFEGMISITFNRSAFFTSIIEHCFINTSTRSHYCIPRSFC